MELRQFADYIESSSEVSVWPGSAPAGLGTAIIAVKDRYNPQELLRQERLPEGFESNVRTIGLMRDMRLVSSVCQDLGGFTGRVIVLTNPVDVFVALVKDWLPDAEVIGLGLSLDMARFSFCARRRGLHVGRNEALLGGIHIGVPIPLRSMWTGDTLTRALGPQLVEELLGDAMRLGPTVVQNIGYTLDLPGAVFVDDLAWLYGSDQTRRYLCASYGEGGSALGWPLVRDGAGRLQKASVACAAEREAIVAAGKNIEDLNSTPKVITTSVAGGQKPAVKGFEDGLLSLGQSDHAREFEQAL